jgi:hypothetical protein
MGRGFEQHGEYHVMPAARREKREKRSKATGPQREILWQEFALVSGVFGSGGFAMQVQETEGGTACGSQRKYL